MQKKSKTEKPWDRATHSRRFFVSRGHIVSYFERPLPSSREGGERLCGVINLREAIALRPTADRTAPANAFDLVLKARTYTLVPFPDTADERDAWLLMWSSVVPALGISSIASDAPTASGAHTTAVAASVREGDDEPSSASAGHARTVSPGLLEGYLLKKPVSGSQLFADMQWRRRFFILRRDAIEWYKEGKDDEGRWINGVQPMIGAMPLEAKARTELRGGRLKINSATQELVVKETGNRRDVSLRGSDSTSFDGVDSGTNDSELSAWHGAISRAISALANGAECRPPAIYGKNSSAHAGEPSQQMPSRKLFVGWGDSSAPIASERLFVSWDQPSWATLPAAVSASYGQGAGAPSASSV